MALYRYVKYKKSPPMKRSILISLFFIGLGAGILSWVSWPIFSFHVFAAPLLTQVISPVSSFHASSNVTSSDVQTIGSDYTNPNIWFPNKPQKKVSTSITAYTFSIPKLSIYNALVLVGGDDLNRSLIHYGGTAVPGEKGNGAIFGHSVLPQFFNPKNYRTIFSTLPNIEVGDDIFLKYDQVTYKYRVEKLTVTSPEDLTMLNQDNDDAYITLVTCVPPGTYWQRLHVKARLIRLD
jgi:sortase A